MEVGSLHDCKRRLFTRPRVFVWVQSFGWIWRVSRKCHCHRVRTALMRVLQQPPLHTNSIIESTLCYRPNLNFLQRAKFTVSQQQNAPIAESENIYSAAPTWGYNSQYFSDKSSAWKHHSDHSRSESGQITAQSSGINAIRSGISWTPKHIAANTTSRNTGHLLEWWRSSGTARRHDFLLKKKLPVKAIFRCSQCEESCGTGRYQVNVRGVKGFRRNMNRPSTAGCVGFTSLIRRTRWLLNRLLYVHMKNNFTIRKRTRKQTNSPRWVVSQYVK